MKAHGGQCQEQVMVERRPLPQSSGSSLSLMTFVCVSCWGLASNPTHAYTLQALAF